MMAAGGEELPFIDRHSAGVAAGPEATWEALNEVLVRSLDSKGSALAARMMGCVDTERSGERPLSEGATLPGFSVLTFEPSIELKLAGRDHFSRYELVFHLTPKGAEWTELTADTRAAFPGLRGRLFRALVIGTRAHVLVMRRLLKTVKREAERL